jgi:hypothetical protein
MGGIPRGDYAWRGRGRKSSVRMEYRFAIVYRIAKRDAARWLFAKTGGADR